jgi:hypothetical protein
LPLVQASFFDQKFYSTFFLKLTHHHDAAAAQHAQ